MTIQGLNLNMSSDATISVKIGDSPCNSVNVSAHNSLTCTLTYGTGVQDVMVNMLYNGIVLSGLKPAGLIQTDILVGGIAEKNVGGFIASIPRPDTYGDMIKYAAAGPFAGYTKITDSMIQTVVFYKNALYFGGSFLSTANTSIRYISSFDGISFAPLGLGVDGPVFSLAIYMDLLIVGGSFQRAFSKLNSDDADDTSGIAAWNGSNWFSITDNNPESVHCIFVNDTIMYVSGAFRREGSFYL